ECREDDLVEVAATERLFDRVHRVVADRDGALGRKAGGLIDQRQGELEDVLALGVMPFALHFGQLRVGGRVRNEQVEACGAARSPIAHRVEERWGRGW